MTSAIMHRTSNMTGQVLQFSNELYADLALERKKRPLLAFSMKKLSENCRHLSSLCDSIIGQNKWEAFFPLKVACLPEIAAKIKANGFGVEIINSAELKCAHTARLSNKILSGNTKSAKLISNGMREDGWRFVVCESIQELKMVDLVAQRSGTIQKILLRLKLTPRRRLGMPPTEILNIMRSASDFPNCQIAGIHAHPGSNVDQATAVKTTTAIENVLDLITASGFGVEYVNFGSGLPTLSTGTSDIEARLQIFNCIALKYGAKIIIEPGRPLIADAACLITSITEVRPRKISCQ